MNKEFFSDILAHKPMLFHAMVQSNKVKCVGISERVAAVLSGKELAEPARFVFWDYAEESRRLALLPPKMLLRLAQVFGIAIHAPEIAHIVKKEQLLPLKADLGEELYHYALYRGQYQLGKIRELFFLLDRQETLCCRAMRHGIASLRACALAWAPELQTRTFARLAKNAAQDADLFSAPLPAPLRQEQNASRLWQALKKLLIHEVAPTWAQCFD